MDQSIGEMVVPIFRLTASDIQNIKTSEIGGTGGRALKSGDVIEEPNVKLGTGLGSRPLSARLDGKENKFDHRYEHAIARSKPSLPGRRGNVSTSTNKSSSAAGGYSPAFGSYAPQVAPAVGAPPSNFPFAFAPPPPPPPPPPSFFASMLPPPPPPPPTSWQLPTTNRQAAAGSVPPNTFDALRAYQQFTGNGNLLAPPGSFPFPKPQGEDK